MALPRLKGTDTSVLRDKIARGRIQSAQAMEDAAREVYAPVVREALDETLEFADTHRYRRGWQLAARGATLYNGPIDQIRESEFKDWRESNLEYSVRFWTLIVERNIRHAQQRGVDPARWRSHRKAVKVKEEAERRLALYRESGGTAGFFYGRAKKGKRGFGLSNLSRVSAEVYGGSGRVIRTGTGALFEMINHEPHSRIVERRKRWAFDLAGRARAFGLRRLRSKAARELSKSSGLMPGRSVA